MAFACLLITSRLDRGSPCLRVEIPVARLEVCEKVCVSCLWCSPGGACATPAVVHNRRRQISLSPPSPPPPLAPDVDHGSHLQGSAGSYVKGRLQGAGTISVPSVLLVASMLVLFLFMFMYCLFDSVTARNLCASTLINMNLWKKEGETFWEVFRVTSVGGS